MEQVLLEGLKFNSGAHLTSVFLSCFLCCSHQSHCKRFFHVSNSLGKQFFEETIMSYGLSQLSGHEKWNTPVFG